jgi:hypothetical protein
MTTPVRKHLVTILDASAEVQHWVDQFVAGARAGAGDWPHQHADIGLTVLPLARFTAVMAEAGWQITADGSVERSSDPGVPLSPTPGPSQGSTYHNVLHSLLGDFH